MRHCLFDEELLDDGRCPEGHQVSSALLGAFSDKEWERLRSGKWVKGRFGDVQFRNGVFRTRARPNRTKRAWDTRETF